MGLVSQRIENFLNGVSQQDERFRHPSQGSKQVNGLSDPARGLLKRPPTEHQAQLDSASGDYVDAFVHLIDRDLDSKYRVVIRNGDLKVFDKEDGTESTVYFPHGKNYLSGSDYRALTLGDRTYILNKDKVVKKDVEKQARRAPEALIFVRQADYATKYSIRIGGYYVEHITSSATSAEAASDIDTTAVAANLYDELFTKEDFPNKFNLNRYGSVLYITRKDSEDFEVSTSDGLADQGLLVVKGTVQRFEDLPLKAKDGFVVEVTGDPGTDKDNYWVQYNEGRGDAEKSGVWEEIAKPGAKTKLEKSTMPHEIVKGGTVIGPGLARKPPVVGLHQVDKYEEVIDEWDNYSDDSGSGSIPSGEEVTLKDPGANVTSPVPDTAEGTETNISAVVGVDTRELDPNNKVQVILEIDDGVGNYTELASRWFSSGVYLTDYVLGPSADHTPAAGSTLRMRMEYSTPTGEQAGEDEYRKAYITPGGITPQIEDPIIGGRYPRHDDDFINLLTLPEPITFAVDPSKLVTFGATEQFPGGFFVRVTVDTTDFDYTPSSTETGKQIAEGLQALVDANANYDATNPADGLLRIKASDGSTVSVSVTYEFQRSNHLWVKDTDLLDKVTVGDTLENVSDGSSASVTAIGTDVIVCDGLSGGVDNKFLERDTFQVVKDGVYFLFRPIEWAERDAGDNESNPFPEFVDETITDILFYQGRLGFIYRDAVYFSRSGEPTNLFRETARTILQSDPIGAEAANPIVNAFHSGVVWEEGVYGISEKGMSLIHGDPILTPSTISMDRVAQWQSTGEVRPVVMGRSLVLIRSGSDGIQVQEVIQEDLENLRMRNLTEHVPTYIQGDPVGVVGSSSLGILLVLTDNPSNGLYVYRWADRGNERIVSSWSKWEFPSGAEILSVDLDLEEIGLLTKWSDAVYLETIDIGTLSQT